MLILSDHGTPAPLHSFLTGHAVREAKAEGWDTLGNGELPLSFSVTRDGRFSGCMSITLSQR